VKDYLAEAQGAEPAKVRRIKTARNVKRAS
jgi:hypothetical protein